jgi:hypothetical protein
MFIRLNDLVVSDGHVIPLFARPRPVGTVNKLATNVSPWDNLTAFINTWSRDA